MPPVQHAAKKINHLTIYYILVAANAGDRIVADGIYCVCAVGGGNLSRQDDPGIITNSR